MKEIFDNYLEISFDGMHQAEFKKKQFEMNYKKYFPNNIKAKVLDVGIGRGEMLSCMKEWGYEYFGVDISPSTVKYCKTINLNCQTVEDTSSWLKNNGNKYSIITCLDVLEHVPKSHTIDFLRAINSSLAPKGIAIIQVPNLQSPFGYLHHFNDFTHESGFVEHSLAQVLMAAGFNNFKFFGFEEIYKKDIKSKLKKILRFLLRIAIRILRSINVNPNPKILDPVMYAIATKR